MQYIKNDVVTFARGFRSDIKTYVDQFVHTKREMAELIGHRSGQGAYRSEPVDGDTVPLRAT